MPINSRWDVDPPLCSVPTWIFGKPDAPMPNTPAWIDPSSPETHSLTYQGARLLAKRLAVGLQEEGAEPGDRVLLFSSNSCYFPPIVISIWMAGCIFTGANPGYTARELAFQLEDSGAALMIATVENEQTAREAAKLAGLSQNRVFVIDGAPVDPYGHIRRKPTSERRNWTELIASVEKGNAFSWTEPADPKDTVCTLNYSSGTTGLPKGVEITHYNIVSNSAAVETLDSQDPLFNRADGPLRALCIIPLYHAFAQLYYIIRYARTRQPVYIMPRFDFPAFLSHIEKFRITNTLGVPPILNAVAKHPLSKKTDFSSLKYFGSGAAPLASETRHAVNKMMPNARVGQGWGMSEITCAGLLWHYQTPINDTSGELCPGLRARIVDVDTGREIQEGGVAGELWIASPTLMRGYWRNPPATEASIVRDEDGTRWFRTGDVVTVDKYAPGALFSIVDRAKELIKVKGNQVAPAELEALLLGREDVADAAVIGVDVDGEERPRAYVVRVEGTNASEEDITKWVAERVVRYKQLRGGVFFLESIPKNPSGKILRKILRAMAKETLLKAKL